jgi:hypothetical protein
MRSAIRCACALGLLQVPAVMLGVTTRGVERAFEILNCRSNLARFAPMPSGVDQVTHAFAPSSFTTIQVNSGCFSRSRSTQARASPSRAALLSVDPVGAGLSAPFSCRVLPFEFTHEGSQVQLEGLLSLQGRGHKRALLDGLAMAVDTIDDRGGSVTRLSLGSWGSAGRAGASGTRPIGEEREGDCPCP